MEDNDKGIVMSCLALLTKGRILIYKSIFRIQWIHIEEEVWMYSSTFET